MEILYQLDFFSCVTACVSINLKQKRTLRCEVKFNIESDLEFVIFPFSIFTFG